MKRSKSQTRNASEARKIPKSAKVVLALPTTHERDPRLAAVGTMIVRPFKGTEHRIEVLEAGFGRVDERRGHAEGRGERARAGWSSSPLRNARFRPRGD